MTRLALFRRMASPSPKTLPGALGLVVLLVAALDAVVILLILDQTVPVPIGAALHIALAGLAYWLLAKWLTEPRLGFFWDSGRAFLGHPVRSLRASPLPGRELRAAYP